MATSSIGEIIQELTAVSDEQLAEATSRQNESGAALGQILVEMGAMSEKDLVRCLGRQWEIPFVDLEEFELDPAVVRQFPAHIIRTYRVVPLRIQDNRVTLAMENPLDIFTIDEIQMATGMTAIPWIASPSDIQMVMRQLNLVDSIGEDDFHDILTDMGEDMVEFRSTGDEEAEDEKALSMVDDAPVVKLVNMIITQALTDGASDIHIQPEAEELRVRYRVDGVLRDATKIPKGIERALISRIKILSDLNIAERRLPQDGRISLTIQGKEYDFRVSVLPAANGEKAVLRVLDKSTTQIGLEKLGFPPDLLKQFVQLIRRTYGIILVSGPTGSGKSTTLYSVLNERNSDDVNIVTAEDPVEYQLPGLTQVQVGIKKELTFASALRSFLRQDPDIIMVGEIRDSETALIATEAALTGHLVLSTIHTNDAPTAVTRMIEMGIEPFLIASAVAGVLAQRLVRKVCSNCAEPYLPPERALARLGISSEDRANATFMTGYGCDRCSDTGLKGRMGIFEMMAVSDPIRSMILKESPAHEIADLAESEGMKTLLEDGLAKVMAGETTADEILRVIHAQ
jgi:type IV pilus assembly protein PilB